MYVVIVKTVADQPLWAGLPDNYPVLCEEFDTQEAANAKYPNKQAMTIDQYKAFADALQSAYPAPELKP